MAVDPFYRGRRQRRDLPHLSNATRVVANETSGCEPFGGRPAFVVLFMLGFIVVADGWVELVCRVEPTKKEISDGLMEATIEILRDAP